MTPSRTTSRRRLLAAVGAATGTAMGGCLGGTGAPSYEDGEVANASGGNRSPAGMVAAEALAQRDPSDTVTSLDALELTEHAFVVEDGYLGATVQGVVENTGAERVETVEVRVRAYDDAGDQLGRYLASTGDLTAGGRWAFTVVVLESPADVDAYDVAVLGTPT